MQKLYMNAANHSGPHLFFAHLWYCSHHWCWLSRNKVNTVLSSNKVPVIRSLKLLYWLSWARKISQLLWLSGKKKTNNYRWITIYCLNKSTLRSMILRLPFLIKLQFNWKTIAAGEKRLRAKERTNNKHNHIWRRHRDFNPGNINGKRVLSPLKPTFLVTHSIKKW